MLLFTASNLTISDNTITGADTDLGINVTERKLRNVAIENNVIRRDGPGTTDPPFGFGVSVDALSTGGATLVCNTFSGWVTNLVDVTQAPCITTTTLPNGAARSGLFGTRGRAHPDSADHLVGHWRQPAPWVDDGGGRDHLRDSHRRRVIYLHRDGD